MWYQSARCSQLTTKADRSTSLARSFDSYALVPLRVFIVFFGPFLFFVIAVPNSNRVWLCLTFFLAIYLSAKMVRVTTTGLFLTPIFFFFHSRLSFQIPPPPFSLVRSAPISDPPLYGNLRVAIRV